METVGIEIALTAHARERMEERGAPEADVRLAIREGFPEEVGGGLYRYRHSFPVRDGWAGRPYGVRHVVPVVALEEGRAVVVTAYAFYASGDATR